MLNLTRICCLVFLLVPMHAFSSGIDNGEKRFLGTSLSGVHLSDRDWGFYYHKGAYDLMGDPGVYFSTSSDEVDSIYFNNLRSIARFVDQFSDYKIILKAYTDPRGETSYNRELRKRRAKAVKGILVEKGARRKQISIGDGGESDLDKPDYRHDRRVDLSLKKLTK